MNQYNVCQHCGKEYNYLLPKGLCTGCLNYEHHNKNYKNDFEKSVSEPLQADMENDWEMEITSNRYMKEEHKKGDDCWNHLENAVRLGRARYACPICGKDVSTAWFYLQLAIHEIDLSDKQ